MVVQAWFIQKRIHWEDLGKHGDLISDLILAEVCTHVSKLHLRFKDFEPMPASVVNGCFGSKTFV